MAMKQETITSNLPELENAILDALLEINDKSHVPCSLYTEVSYTQFIFSDIVPKESCLHYR